MAKSIRTEVIINGVDNLSPVVVRATDRSEKSLHRLSRNISSITSGAFATGRAAGGLSAALAAPLIYAGKKAVDFEEEMANVAKVTDLAVGSAGIRAMGEDVKDLSVYLGESATDAAAMYANLAQGGVVKKELKDVAKFVGQVGIAYDTTADIAGESFVKTANGLGYTMQRTFSVFDAVNELSDKTAAKASEITTFLASGAASVARNYGLSGEQISAFGATLISSGKSGEAASTIMERFAKNINKSAQATKTYKNAGRGMSGFLAVLSEGASIKDIDKQEKYFSAFQEYGAEIRALANGMTGPGGLNESIKIVSDSQNYAGSVSKEVANKFSTSSRKIKQDWAGIQRAAIDAGETMLPVIHKVAEDLSPIIQSVSGWIKKNPELTVTIIKATAGLAAFSAVVSGISFLIGGVTTTIGAFTTVLSAFKAGGILAGVIPWLSSFGSGLWVAAGAATVLGAPVWAVVAAVTAVGAGFYYAYKNVEWFRVGVEKVAARVTAVWDHLGDLFSASWSGDFKKVKNIRAAIDLQSDINSTDAINKWKAEKGGEPDPYAKYKLSPQRLAEIEKGRSKPVTYAASPYSGKGAKGVNPNRRTPIDPKYLEPSKPNSYIQPNPVSDVSGKMSVKYNPIININGAGSADAAALQKTLDEDKRRFKQELKKVYKNKNRVSIE